MKMYLLSDNIDTHTGMRLAGVEGEVLHTREEFVAAFERAVQCEDNAIIAVTEKLSAICGDVIAAYTKKNARPLVTVIPDRHTGEKEASQNDVQ